MIFIILLRKSSTPLKVENNKYPIEFLLIGGRARQFKERGFTFDMGPSWYWMPDVFERFFNDFDKTSADFYNLKKLNPAYHVYFGENDYIAIPDEIEKICNVFEKEEKGSSIELLKFMKIVRCSL